MLFATVLLPIMFDDIVKTPAVPAVCIPYAVCAWATLAVDTPPILLPLIVTAPVDVE